MRRPRQMDSKPPRESLIFQALHDAYPKPVDAKQLMNRAGLSWRTDPVRSFTLLCISFSLSRRAAAERNT